ncbi:sensor histidine kinase [Massilia sp. CCM 8733]|uniref:histidine kinase n=1 Tax=Massilia mucilaginosa TaxID=2609282 RepID=A0ABX0P1G1_9BURK|nr:HAMP domain-containing sensor histidine kinase [Massilia mucilaginosa]NHZ93067.1 sensor histidine kinase [Massilia mucilaginosa]
MTFASATAPLSADRLRQSLLRWLLQWLVRHEGHHAHATGRFILLAWIGFLGMPAYYSIWTYWFPQEFESLALRMVGAALCLPALAPGRLLRGRFVNAYLFIAVTYVLPFQFVFMYLMNHGSAVWSQSLLIALTVLFHFRTRWALAACAAGSALACALFALVGDAAFMLSPTVLEQLPIYAFTIIAVSVAKAGRGALAREKLAGMAHALASVSHELRTPLVSVEANVRGIGRRIAPPAKASEADWQAMSEAMARIQYEVRHMKHMIDLFLLSASAVEQRLEATELVSMREVVDSVIRRYPFAAQSQRDAVSVDIRTDFRFAGKHELSVVILLNLLRNALKALHRAGKGRIRIVVDGRPELPRLLVIDTGCGIAERHLPLIFQRFYSYPPSSGAGIGLALCKDIIDAWHASIRCVSRELGYTMFVLEFPRVAVPPDPH